MRALLLLIPLAAAVAQPPLPLPRRLPLWSDEFEGPAGSLPDASKWTYDLGRGRNGCPHRRGSAADDQEEDRP